MYTVWSLQYFSYGNYQSIKGSVRPISVSVSVSADISLFCRYRYRPIIIGIVRYRRPIFLFYKIINMDKKSKNSRLRKSQVCNNWCWEALFNCRWCRLSPANAHKILYLCENMPFLRFQYYWISADNIGRYIGNLPIYRYRYRYR